MTTEREKQIEMNPIDIEKPNLKDCETLCDGCWAVTSDTTNWFWLSFKHLKASWLCAGCRENYQKQFEEIQGEGL